MDYVNHGFVATGNANVNIGNMAVGPHARAVNYQSAPAAHLPALQRLDEFAALIERRGTPATDADATAATDVLREELASAHPNRGRVLAAVGRLGQWAAAAGGVAAGTNELVSALDGLKDSVLGLFG